MWSDIAQKSAWRLRQRGGEGRFSSDWIPGGPRRNVHLMSNPVAQRRLTNSFQVNSLLLYLQFSGLNSKFFLPKAQKPLPNHTSASSIVNIYTMIVTASEDAWFPHRGLRFFSKGSGRYLKMKALYVLQPSIIGEIFLKELQFNEDLKREGVSLRGYH